MEIDDIILKEDSCTIYSSKARRVNAMIEDILFIATIIVFFIVCLNRLHGGAIAIFVFFGLCSLLMLYGSIKRLKNPPSPIILTPKGVTLPDGNFIIWQEIEFIKFNHHPYPALPDLIIKNKNGKIEELSNWDKYTSKKKLVLLFETYAGRKLLKKN